MKSNYRRIGDFIQLVDVRNDDLAVDTLLGLSISKQFIPSVANTVGTNMKRYKIIKKNQFACSIMQVRRDKKMPVAILKDFDEAIISQAYPVFEVKDETELLPDYLMMWFSRSEFDRQATFWAVGGVRGSLEWDDFLNFDFPKPDIEEQRAIVAQYQTVTDRIQLNEQINVKLEETAQALYRHWFVDFEFPDENGKPYKSSGGKMVWSEELEKEVPEGWELITLDDISEVKTGPFGSALLNEQYIVGGTPVVTVEHIKEFRVKSLNYPSVDEEDRIRLSAYSLKEGDIIFSRVGSVDLSALVSKRNNGWLFSSRMLRVRPNIENSEPILISYFLKYPDTRKLILSLSVGSTMQSINTQILKGIPFLHYPKQLGERCCDTFTKINDKREILFKQNEALTLTLNVLLSKMASNNSNQKHLPYES